MDREVFELFNAFIDRFKAATFICRGCGEIIYPKVTANEQGIFIESNRAEVRGAREIIVLKKMFVKSA